MADNIVDVRAVITEYNLIDEGVDSSSYWSGRGTGDYNHVVTGYGDGPEMAIDDLCEMFADQWRPSAKLEVELEDTVKGIDPKDVDTHSDCRTTWEQETLTYDLDGEPITVLDDNGDPIDMEEKWYEWHEACDLYYRVSLQFDCSDCASGTH